MDRRSMLGAMGALVATGVMPVMPAMAAATNRILVGATPGGGTDLVARAIAAGLQSELDTQFIVENKPGAAGNLAAGEVAKSAGDASTLLVCYTSHAINPSMFSNLPFKPLDDFTPLSLLARSPLVLVTRADFPANDLKGMFDLVRKEPQKHSIAVAGVGSANQLAGEMLKKEADLDLISVPYKGAAPALQDTMGGQVDMLFSNMASAKELVAAKKLKVLAVSTKEPVEEFPGAKPVAELLPDFDYASWYGLLGPAGLKPDDVARLSKAAAQAARGEQMSTHLKNEGLVPIGSTAAEFNAFLRQEMDRWAKVVQATGVKAG